jgi:hypothetical protein
METQSWLTGARTRSTQHYCPKRPRSPLAFPRSGHDSFRSPQHSTPDCSPSLANRLMPPTKHSESQCETCAFFAEAILRAFSSTEVAVAKEPVEVSRLISAFSRDCPNCRFVLDYFARRAPNSPLRPTCPMQLLIYPQKRLLMEPVSRPFHPPGIVTCLPNHMESLPTLFIFAQFC